MELPNIIDKLIASGRPFIDQFGIWAMFVGLVGETFLFTGFWMPGVVLLIAGGYLAGGGEMALGPLVVSSWMGAILGDVLSFGLGSWLGFRLLKKRQGFTSRVLRALDRNRNLMLLTYHYSPFLRSIVPCACGSSGFPFRKWLPYDVAGVLIWVVVFIGAGYFARGATHGQSNYVIHVVNGLAFILTMLLMWQLYRAASPREPEESETSDSESPRAAEEHDHL